MLSSPVGVLSSPFGVLSSSFGVLPSPVGVMSSPEVDLKSCKHIVQMIPTLIKPERRMYGRKWPSTSCQVVAKI